MSFFFQTRLDIFSFLLFSSVSSALIGRPLWDWTHSGFRFNAFNFLSFLRVSPALIGRQYGALKHSGFRSNVSNFSVSPALIGCQYGTRRIRVLIAVFGA